MKTAVVVGYGSIGARHAQLLRELGLGVAVVSRRKVDHPNRFATIEAALGNGSPDLVVIASRTNEHYADFKALGAASYCGTVLVEKPLFGGDYPLPAHRFERAYIAFNMRFHPLVLAFRKALAGRKIFALHAYAGQYLPDWRPNADYRTGYSAHKEQGGGVLRDLCHELDLVCWFGGAPRAITALGGKVSDLEIDSEDVFSLLLELQNCPVATVTTNYLDSRLRRTLIAQTDTGTVCADLAALTLTDGDTETSIPSGPNESYLAQLKAVIENDDTLLCPLAGGQSVNSIIDNAERASIQREWIST
jgi:predicted dehydrogenase